MTVKFPCKICEKPVAKNHNAIQCKSCKFGYTLSAIKLIHKSTSTFKTLILNGTA